MVSLDKILKDLLWNCVGSNGQGGPKYPSHYGQAVWILIDLHFMCSALRLLCRSVGIHSSLIITSTGIYTNSPTPLTEPAFERHNTSISLSHKARAAIGRALMAGFHGGIKRILR